MKSDRSTNPAQRADSILHVARDVRTAWRLLWDRRVPASYKMIPFLSFLYLLFPIDLVPDLAVGLGQVDDLAVILLGLKLFVHLASPILGGSGADGDAPGGSSDGRGPQVIDTTYRVLDDDDHDDAAKEGPFWVEPRN